MTPDYDEYDEAREVFLSEELEYLLENGLEPPREGVEP
jgi:hypothetical protein